MALMQQKKDEEATSSSVSASLEIKLPLSHTQYPYVTGSSVLGIKYKDGVLIAADCGGMAMVIMGVSGSGKSTIGHLLAKSLGCPFLDADDFHTAENKEKMRKGIPLADSDRLPWLETLRDTLMEYILRGKAVVLACSALKPVYRNILRSADYEWMLEMEGKEQGDPLLEQSTCQEVQGNDWSSMYVKASATSKRVCFYLLNGSVEVFASRLERRLKEGAHFMPPSLLQSQVDTLEISQSEEDVYILDGTMSTEAIVAEIKKQIGQDV